MGLDDRDYTRSGYDDGYSSRFGGGYGSPPGFQLGMPKTVTVRLVIVNVIVFVIQLLFRGDNPLAISQFDYLFSLHPDWYRESWRFFELLTYGFLHSPWNAWHIAGNMFVLWMFGRSVEERYGSKEFLAFYLTAIILAGIFWTLTELAVENPLPMLGASGGVSAVLLLFIFCYPRVTILFMFIIPMPAWVLGVFIVGSDLMGALQRSGIVAFTAHLGGFLFAFLYYKSGIRLTDYLPTSLKMPSFQRKPPLKVHRPPSDDREDKTERRLNELLDKVHAGGQDSLTASERRELKKLSKHYQNRRR